MSNRSSLYKFCFGHLVIKGQFTRKSRARQWAAKHYGADAREGYDYEFVQTAEGKWAAEPGPKYDSPPKGVLKQCQECEQTSEQLHADPRDPPLDDEDCLCEDCRAAALDEAIVDTETHLSKLRAARAAVMGDRDAR